MAHEVPLSMGFPRQEYWSGLPVPSSGDLPDPGIEPASLTLAGGFFTTKPRGKFFFVFYQLLTIARHYFNKFAFSSFNNQNSTEE